MGQNSEQKMKDFQEKKLESFLALSVAAHHWLYNSTKRMINPLDCHRQHLQSETAKRRRCVGNMPGSRLHHHVRRYVIVLKNKKNQNLWVQLLTLCLASCRCSRTKSCSRRGVSFKPSGHH